MKFNLENRPILNRSADVKNNAMYVNWWFEGFEKELRAIIEKTIHREEDGRIFGESACNDILREILGES